MYRVQLKLSIKKHEIQYIAWWSHQMETFAALLAICSENSPVPGEFHTQRPVTWSFDVYFDLCLNKRLSKQSWGWWFETLSSTLWCHRNGLFCYMQKSHGIILYIIEHDKILWYKHNVFHFDNWNCWCNNFIGVQIIAMYHRWTW